MKVPVDGPEAGPEPVASIVAYLTRPEAYFITGPRSVGIFFQALTYRSYHRSNCYRRWRVDGCINNSVIAVLLDGLVLLAGV